MVPDKITESCFLSIFKNRKVSLGHFKRKTLSKEELSDGSLIFMHQ